LNEVARNCVDIATDKIGTTVIQKCLRQGDITATALLVTEIVSNAMVLAEDPYGFDSKLFTIISFEVLKDIYVCL
jgi:hypothetical protein